MTQEKMAYVEDRGKEGLATITRIGIDGSKDIERVDLTPFVANLGPDAFGEANP